MCFGSWLRPHVFSTYVEVILRSEKSNEKIRSVLHVCGGDPTVDFLEGLSDKCSPRMWR